MQNVKEIYTKIRTHIAEATFEELFAKGAYYTFSTWIHGEEQKVSEFQHIAEVGMGKIVFTIVVPKDVDMFYKRNHEKLAEQYKEYGRFANLNELALLGAENYSLQTSFEGLYAFGSYVSGGGRKFYPYLSYEMYDDGRKKMETCPRKRGFLLNNSGDAVFSASGNFLPVGIVFVAYPKRTKK
jgi:hypothetical protein